MYEIKDLTIKLTRGDSFYTQIGMTTDDGQPYVPEEGDSLRFVMKNAKIVGGEYVDEEPVLEKNIPTDTLVLTLAPADTSDLPFGRYVYDIELTFASGDVDTFINNESFFLEPEVD